MRLLDYRKRRLSYTKVKTERRLLLDRYPGAVAAYSLKKLRRDYRGPCVRLRKRVGGTADYHADFGFRFGELDWEAVQRWLDGTDDGLVADDGLVWAVIWYNQVLSYAGDMVENTVANQPMLDVANRRIDTLTDFPRGFTISWPNRNQNVQIVSDILDYKSFITDSWIYSAFAPLYRLTFSQSLTRTRFNYEIHISPFIDENLFIEYAGHDYMAMGANSDTYFGALKKNGQVDYLSGNYPVSYNSTYSNSVGMFYSQDKSGNYYFRLSMIVIFTDTDFTRSMNLLNGL